MVYFFIQIGFVSADPYETAIKCPALNRKLHFLFVPDFLFHMHCIARWLLRHQAKIGVVRFFWEDSDTVELGWSRSATELQPVYTHTHIHTDLNVNKSAPLSFQSRDALQARPLH